MSMPNSFWSCYFSLDVWRERSISVFRFECLHSFFFFCFAQASFSATRVHEKKYIQSIWKNHIVDLIQVSKITLMHSLILMKNYQYVFATRQIICKIGRWFVNLKTIFVIRLFVFENRTNRQLYNNHFKVTISRN